MAEREFFPQPKPTKKKPYKRKSKPKMSTRKNFSLKVRQEAYELYNGMCGVCHSQKAVDPHHIKFRSDGGKGVLTNCLPVCRECHIEIHKNDELAMSLRAEAKAKHGYMYWADEWDMKG